MEISAKAQITFAPVYSIGEMTRDVHISATDLLQRIPDSQLGNVLMPGLMYNLSETPGSVRWTGPELGNSTDAVLIDELGFDRAQIYKLRERGVVR